jgi:DNA-binding CsgD family transcriptional regulator
MGGPKSRVRRGERDGDFESPPDSFDPGGAAARPADLRASSIEVGRGRYVLLSFPRAPSATSGLTPAEREVALAVLAGLSNADIARARGSSARTVANQVASVFRKLGVRSRAELAALGPSLVG